MNDDESWLKKKMRLKKKGWKKNWHKVHSEDKTFRNGFQPRFVLSSHGTLLSGNRGIRTRLARDAARWGRAGFCYLAGSTVGRQRRSSWLHKGGFKLRALSVTPKPIQCCWLRESRKLQSRIDALTHSLSLFLSQSPHLKQRALRVILTQNAIAT